MNTSPHPTKRLNAEERKQQILEHALQLISQYGFKSVSIRDIARAAQVNEALIYHHFPSKADLLKAIIVDVVNTQPVHTTVSCTNLESFCRQISSFVNFYLKTNLANPAFIRIILYSVMEDYPLPEEFNLNKPGTFLNWLYSSIKKGQAEWGFDPELDPTVATSNFMGGLIVTILQISVLKQIPPIDPDSYTQSYIHSFLALLKG
jgi:AcrR family transcriptional regulator